MPIPLPETSGNLQSEYTASVNIGSTQNSQDGAYTSTPTIGINYTRTDYVLDAEGRRIGIVQAPMGPMGDSTRHGQLAFTGPQVAEAFGITVGELEAIVDGLVSADLIKRGIL